MTTTITRLNGSSIIEDFKGSVKETVEHCVESRISLHRADLRGTDLYSADLRNADLRYADLGGAYLRGAYLCGADLRYTEVIGFHLGKDFGFAHFGKQYDAGAYVKIGCYGHTLDYWLRNYKDIGKEHSYTDAAISLYGGFLKLLESKKG